MALVYNPLTGLMEDNGLGPAAAGYSANPTTAQAQANMDAQSQAQALQRQAIATANQAQPGVAAGYSANLFTANAQAAADAQAQAAATVPAPVPQLLGPQGRGLQAASIGAAATPLSGPRGLGSLAPTPPVLAGAGGPRGGGAMIPVVDTPTPAIAPVMAAATQTAPLFAGPTPSFPASSPLVPSADDSSGNTLVPATPAPVTPAPDYLAMVNQQLARNGVPPSTRPALQPGVNSFDQTNTVGGGGPPSNAGLNFGFGPAGSGTSASEVLAGYAERDRQSRLDQRAQAAVLEQRSLVSHLNDEQDPIKRRLLLRQLDLGAQSQGQAAGLAQTNAGQTAAGRAQARAAQVQQATAQLNAQVEARSRLAQADITGQYGLQGARIKAAASADTAAATRQSTAGTQRKANSEADLLDTRLAAIRAGVDVGQLDPVTGVIAASKTGFEPRVPLPIDPLTNLPYTPEAYAALQQTATIQAARGLKAAQTR